MIKQYQYINIKKTPIDLNKSQIIIWGRSVSALNLYTQLVEKKLKNKIIGFTDSNALIQENELFLELPVYTLNDLCEKREKNIYIYISTINRKFLIDILDKLEDIGGYKVITEIDVWGPGKYNVQSMEKKIKDDEEEIEWLYNELADSESRKVFENLIKYRKSNDKNLLYEIYEKEHKQYFPDKKIMTPQKDEVFIDAGAYNGATSYEFIKWNPEYKEIIMLEADEEMYKVSKEYIKIKEMKNVKILNVGAYSKKDKILFNSDISTGSSLISKDGTISIETDSIDHILGNNKATYIKMDIEGAEREALYGCEKTINKFRPKLAISIYHREDDLWKIPIYIKKKYPFYKIFIRHYTEITTETILYATE